MANPGDKTPRSIFCPMCGMDCLFTIDDSGDALLCDGCDEELTGVSCQVWDQLFPPTKAAPAPVLVPPPPTGPTHARLLSVAMVPGLINLGLNSVARGRPTRHWRPGDVVPGRKCSRCKNESIRIESMSEREVEDPCSFTLAAPIKIKVLASVKVSCRLCGSDSGTIQAQDLPSA